MTATPGNLELMCFPGAHFHVVFSLEAFVVVLTGLR